MKSKKKSYKGKSAKDIFEETKNEGAKGKLKGKCSWPFFFLLLPFQLEWEDGLGLAFLKKIKKGWNWDFGPGVVIDSIETREKIWPSIFVGITSSN